jgi:hypothetical protein
VRGHRAGLVKKLVILKLTNFIDPYFYNIRVK